MKKLILVIVCIAATSGLLAQDTANRRLSKKEKKEEKRRRIDAMIKQEEEGNLSYFKQSAFGIQLRTNGWGFFYELGKRRSPRYSSSYSFEFNETKHPKEERVGGGFFSNPFTYAKINSFYQGKLGYGQQYILGQKGNKNGIAVIALAQGGVSAGLVKPYYLDIGGGGPSAFIRYDQDSVRFLNPPDGTSGAGPFKGWGEISVVPGVYAKAALRFDFARYNESVQAIEIGLSADYYTKDIQLMAPLSKDARASGPRQLFFQGHIAFVFGRRK